LKGRDVEARYNDNLRRQQKILDDFTLHEIDFAEDLLMWYRVKKKDMPDDEYRACAFFKNKEYRNKTGSITLLYEMYVRCNNELPKVTRENAIDLLRFRFKMYTKVLEKGGY